MLEHPCSLKVSTWPSLAKLATRSECDIRKNFDTNEYPNIFVSKNDMILIFLCPFQVAVSLNTSECKLPSSRSMM